MAEASVAIATHNVPGKGQVCVSPLRWWQYAGCLKEATAYVHKHFNAWEPVCACQPSTGRLQWLNVEKLRVSLPSKREPTCPLKASMMKWSAWGWTHSIHFCTTWLPFWSFTHFSTWPSSSRTISLCRERGQRVMWSCVSDTARKHFPTSHLSQPLVAQQIRLCFEPLPWRNLLKSIKERWILLCLTNSHHLSLPQCSEFKSTFCRCSATFFSLPAEQY